MWNGLKDDPSAFFTSWNNGVTPISAYTPSKLKLALRRALRLNMLNGMLL